jgi:hypothetical protein
LGHTKISKSFTQKIHVRNSETTLGCTVELHRDALGTAKNVQSNSCEHNGVPSEQTEGQGELSQVSGCDIIKRKITLVRGHSVAKLFAKTKNEEP